ncbi:MAG: TIR domain-containing protein [Anaerolineaceae bacterium]|nr:TIR domain-containing protein [Anaerolineaceae bacterium]
MIIKCKMCGGDILFNPGDTCGQCDHCGCTTTFPKLPDEQRANLFNRANHFRRQCEFDKAMAAYEHILEVDDTDAEAHWGIVLSKFGIEYVEDPVTHERIPTCHRAQVISILSDEDYQNAIKYAPDIQSREIYEQEAKRIAEIQKGILAISSQEKPYDVFICYKETDDNGSRTKDSAIAQEIYYQLINEGYKVFFSRITLEDKLGQEYEPYIFAALNSTKVMLVVGTKPENLSAVWVKNEWSRFLAIMKNDRKRVLIPCYRDMDPYDLPDELSSLQSQDMSKIGFMQDLIRGIRKVLDDGKKAAPSTIVQQVMQTAASDISSPGVTSLMKRIWLFLEDGDFRQASEYIDRVLDIDPEYAPAYVAKVCVTFGIHKETDLAETTFQYEDNLDWKKAIRFADPQQKAVYREYAAKVKDRVTNQIRDYASDCATEMAVTPSADRKTLDAELAAYKVSCTQSVGKRADGNRREGYQIKEDIFNRAVKANEPGEMTESNLRSAASMFDVIGDDVAKERAKQCRTLAEEARQKAIYSKAASIRDNKQSSLSDLEEAARVFQIVPDYKDAKTQMQACLDKAESIRNELYESAVKAMKTAGEESDKWAAAKKKLDVAELTDYRNVSQLRTKASKRYAECVAAEREAKRQEEERKRRETAAVAAKKKRNVLIGILAIVLVVAAALVVMLVFIPRSNYRNAIALQKAGKYEEAIAAFEALNGYSDSETQIEACRNSIKEHDYQEALVLQQAGEYEKAIAAFESLNGYSDSKVQIEACRDSINEHNYQEAVALQQAGEYEEAIAAFKALNGYSDSKVQIEACRNSIKEHDYKEAVALQQAGEYEKAIAAYEALNGYNDSKVQIEACRNSIKEHDYKEAVALQQAGEYEKAITAFEALNGYNDSEAKVTETKYLQGKSLKADGEYAKAAAIFMDIKGYKDVDKLLTNYYISAAVRDAKYAVGNYVTFGTYPQTEAGDDSTSIEWIVLARDGQKALLISRYALDAKPYNTENKSITWEECTLRTWLNDTFMHKAFTAQEQEGIILTNVDNSNGQGYNSSTNGGNDTQDRVFLLSCAETKQYLDSGTKENVVLTAYAKKEGASVSESSRRKDIKTALWWWLRSPGNSQSDAAVLLNDGIIYYTYVYLESVSVRPALWINLESDIF